MDFFPIIREIHKSEIHFLEEMLYEAIYIPNGAKKLRKDIIYNPELFIYIKDFGKTGDICLVAEIQGNLVGAAWSRLFTEDEKGYGFIDTETPELSIAVVEQYRHQGIGKLLLEGIIKKWMEQNYNQVSLSVDKQNYACRLYSKFGFGIYSSAEKSAVMVKRFFENNLYCLNFPDSSVSPDNNG